jgi:hypothetical protein
MRLVLRLSLATGMLLLGATGSLAREAVTETDLSLRSGPGQRHEVLLTLPAGAVVRVRECSRGWCNVVWKGYDGFASQDGLRPEIRGMKVIPGAAQVIPVYPPYPYRAGYYPKADWYFDLPPYAATLPQFHRRRYFMMAQERNRYRYMPHIFSGYNGDGSTIK